MAGRAKRVKPVDVARVNAALEQAADATGAFRSTILRTDADERAAAHEEAMYAQDDKGGMRRIQMVDDVRDQPRPVARATITPPTTTPPPAQPEADRPTYRDPSADLKAEAIAVARLMDTLKDMGVSCVDSIQASIDSETNFREMIEARLRAEGEIDALIAGLSQYIDTLSERVRSYKKAKDAIRQVLLTAMENARQTSIPTAYGTVHTIVGKYSMSVTNEELVPAGFFKQVVDTTKLKSEMEARRNERERIDAIEDDGERAEARDAFTRANPIEIRGAELTLGKTSLGIRRK